MLIQLSDPQPTRAVPDISQPLSDSQTIETAAGSFALKRVLLTEGSQRRVELLMVQSDRVRAAICPTRGMSLWKASIDDVAYGWESPVKGPIHPSLVALEESSGLGWLDGFDELLVRCGLRSFGAPDFDEKTGNLLFPLHGRIGNLPANDLSVEVDQEHSLLRVRGTIRETRFLQYNLSLVVTYSFALGEPTIDIQDRVSNLSGTPSDVQLLYHINIGKPVLGKGARLHQSTDRVVARNEHAAADISFWQTYLPPTAGFEEQVYFSKAQPDQDGWAVAVLESADSSRGFAVRYQTEQLPFFTQWKNTVAEADGYVTGLEPGTGFPNPRTFEQQQGRLKRLGPGESLDFHVKLEGLNGPEAVAARISEVEKICDDTVAVDDFDAAWCLPRE